jgi:hypothetical protein
MKTVLALSAGACAGMLIVGCGGGNSSGAARTNNLVIGEASITYDGAAKPFVAQGTGSVTLTGMAGASYSNFTVVPTKDMRNSVLLYQAGGASLWTDSNGILSQVTSAAVPALAGCFTNDGRILFLGLDNPTANFYLYTCYYDGSGTTKLLSTPVGTGVAPAWSPNGKLIAWSNPSGSLYVSGVNGSNAVLISTTGQSPAFSPDSTTLAFTQKNTGGYSQVYTVPVTGGTPVLYGPSSGSTEAQSSTANYDNPQWAPDGNSILMTDDTGTVRSLAWFSSIAGDLLGVAQPSGDVDDFEGSFAPDDKTIVFVLGTTYNSAGSITTSDFGGDNPETLVPPTVGSGLSLPSWSPFPGSRTFVGTSGAMFTTPIAGFLWGQVGPAFSSLVTFTAPVPADATITAQTNSGSGSLIFDVHADQITGMKYTNSYFVSATTLISNSSSNPTDALVSFDSGNGQVETVAPFVVNRTAVPPVRTGSTLTYQAKFFGVWNKAGKNLAPNGASTVTLDAKTGHLISFR